MRFLLFILMLCFVGLASPIAFGQPTPEDNESALATRKREFKERGYVLFSRTNKALSSYGLSNLEEAFLNPDGSFWKGRRYYWLNVKRGPDKVLTAGSSPNFPNHLSGITRILLAIPELEDACSGNCLVEIEFADQFDANTAWRRVSVHRDSSLHPTEFLLVLALQIENLSAHDFQLSTVKDFYRPQVTNNPVPAGDGLLEGETIPDEAAEVFAQVPVQAHAGYIVRETHVPHIYHGSTRSGRKPDDSTEAFRRVAIFRINPQNSESYPAAYNYYSRFHPTLIPALEIDPPIPDLAPEAIDGVIQGLSSWRNALFGVTSDGWKEFANIGWSSIGLERADR